MTNSNVEETADIVSFHLEQDPNAPHIVVRVTGRDYTEEDIAAIVQNVIATSVGVTISGRFVPESEHGLVGESIIEFSQNNNNDTGGI